MTSDSSQSVCGATRPMSGGASVCAAASETSAVRWTISGHVQGLGVRPAIYRLASELGLGGSVRNTSRGVEIEVEGSAAALAEFDANLLAYLPPASCVADTTIESIAPSGRREFAIVKEAADGPVRACIPEDRAVCPRCEAEINDRRNRRWRYPLTSCTSCGPRYTVIRAMPFEREDSALADFPLCSACLREYEHPADRRFHAQTTACAACGPRIWATNGDGQIQRAHDAVRAAAAALTAGKIVALRGVGGYQLLVDATNAAAVERLRQRKQRPAKPLAVMASSLAAAERLGYFDATERDAFSSAAAPIVLVRARTEGNLAPGIAPHLDIVGLMRPTTPLHSLLSRQAGRPLVCTSGNREGDPLEYEVNAAADRLAGLGDVWLHHNRPIERPIDDSVVRVIAGRTVTIRLARGLAPLSLDLPPMPPTLAVGGYLKAAVACSNGAQAALAPHLGDQASLAARERFLAQVADWQRLYRFTPDLLVHDLHPEYYSTRWAMSQALPTLGVQHHFAHIAAGMCEHGLLDRCVLGAAWDGTGYGTDGTIWGGEFLVATGKGVERVARLRPFRLPGGEAAIHEPWRTAVAICRQLTEPPKLSSWPGWSITTQQIEAVSRIAERPQLSPVTTSAGRLIDAAAALVLGVEQAEFDGQPAMRLEAVADRSAPGEYGFPVQEARLLDLDWRTLFRGLLADLRDGVEPPVLAMKFHRSLARGIVCVSERFPTLPLVLSGGVFQNRLLTELVAEYYHNPRSPLALPGLVPPNDGGLAAGQLAVASLQGGSPRCV